MNEKKWIQCKDCGVMYPADHKHECDIKVLHGYQMGKADAVESRRMNVCNKCKWCYWYCQSVDLANKCDGDTQTCADFIKVLSRGKRTEANKSFNEAYAKGRADAYAEVDNLIAEMQESAEAQMRFVHAEICEIIRERIKESKDDTQRID